MQMLKMSAGWIFVIVSVCVFCGNLHAGEIDADDNCRPETWFHLIGGNVSKEGLVADLDAIKSAGIRGNHLFHGSS